MTLFGTVGRDEKLWSRNRRDFFLLLPFLKSRGINNIRACISATLIYADVKRINHWLGSVDARFVKERLSATDSLRSPGMIMYYNLWTGDTRNFWISNSSYLERRRRTSLSICINEWTLRYNVTLALICYICTYITFDTCLDFWKIITIPLREIK